ncbi:hypothetical protein [Bradyrhizobium sp. SZCCHNS3051]|uniref:hypothetical protein n=1 Tax=Bradyrhizobium sp. SZCCHNS3051 TaxID=3057320 RepID=UPI002915FF9A|nr:hypothetical protein [Bradyrhizobium sp. SZCCHNS3051]
MVVHGGAVISSGHLQNYLQRVGTLNAKAAICGAIGVTLSTVSGVIGPLLSGISS